jgi:uncharacterized protein (UPF0333 family)
MCKNILSHSLNFSTLLRVALLVAMLTGGLLVSFVGLVSLAYAATAAAMTIAQAATQASQRMKPQLL